MKRDAVYYVMPMGEIWLIRAIGSSAEAYPTLEDALAAAERLAARGAHVRVLSRSPSTPGLSPGIANTSAQPSSAVMPLSTVTSVSTVTTVAAVTSADEDSDPVRRAAS
jgi:hypothetical protein